METGVDATQQEITFCVHCKHVRIVKDDDKKGKPRYWDYYCKAIKPEKVRDPVTGEREYRFIIRGRVHEDDEPYCHCGLINKGNCEYFERKKSFQAKGYSGKIKTLLFGE